MSETLFKKVDYSLSKLMDDIEMGTIGLPDIQRPFVWKNAKIRDLFDSIYRGYPVGYFLFWQNSFDGSQKQIGTDQKQKVAHLLIVDGQQRLTSLFAVIKGVPIVRESYEKEQIEIAFRPTDESFEVADAAIRKDSEYIPNISILWAKNANLFDIVGDYIENLKKHRDSAGTPLSTDEIKKIQTAMQRVSNLLSYPFTALELAASINEEQVAEVFVRINSKGKVLNQSDFILTLMSVFWDEGRTQLEDFCRETRIPSKNKPSPFNHFIEPDPDNLLRVSIGVGFRRARLKYGYSLLRGKDLETDQFSDQRRVEQFDILKAAQADVLNLQNWHGFLRTLHLAGYRGSHMISSSTTLIYAYVFYLIGKKSFKIEGFTLSNVIAQWFFMSSLTGRYTGGSPETAMEKDLALIRDFKTADQLLNWMTKTIESEFTDDFWNITLPNRLDTSSATSPILYAYNASLNLLHAKVLFSNKKVVDLLDPTQKGDKSAAERHHLFTKKYLKAKGITATRDTNQIANFALVEWDDNIAISGDSPEDYYPVYSQRFSEHELAQMCHWHALPLNWHKMDYRDFLEARRKLIAKIIKEGFGHIAHGTAAGVELKDDRPIAEIIAAGETTRIEFKSTLRVNLHTGQPDKKMEHSCLKTIAAFLNSHGGHLVIGVADSGEVLGIEKDGFPNEDKMNLHMVNLLKDRLGPQHMLHIDPRFETLDGKKVLVVRCRPSNLPVYLKDGTTEQFFARTGAATTELLPSQIQAYIQQRF
ncbi:MAG: DUF262 domain-containing protein [Planctomycetes bacterium]|nr:DUF262 domain-containing protein [Planctomycetota bacterium]